LGQIPLPPAWGYFGCADVTERITTMAATLDRQASVARLQRSSMRCRNSFGVLLPERAYDGLRVALTAGQNLLKVHSMQPRPSGPQLVVANTCPSHADAEAEAMQCNDKYWAVPWSVSAGGVSGSLHIGSIYRPGKAPQSPFLVRGMRPPRDRIVAARRLMACWPCCRKRVH